MVMVLVPAPLLYVSMLLASIFQFVNVAAVRFTRFLRVRAAKGGIVVLVLSLMISVFVGAILVNKFEGVIDDARPGSSLEFNDTADDLVDNTWTVFIFLAIGIIIVGAAWILRQAGLLG